MSESKNEIRHQPGRLTPGYDRETKVRTLTVRDLIEQLSELEPSARVTILGDAMSAWALGQVIDDDNGSWVCLARGERLPDVVDDDG